MTLPLPVPGTTPWDDDAEITFRYLEALSVAEKARAMAAEAAIGPGGGGAGGAPPLWYTPGTLAVVAGKASLPILSAQTIDHIYLRVDTAPSGGDLTVDIFRNRHDGGGSIFTTVAKPKILAGQLTSVSLTPNITALAVNDYLHQDVLSPIPPGFPGSDLIVVVVFA